MFATKISGAKAKTLTAKGALLFDIRTPVEFRDGSLPGALNLPLRAVGSIIKYPKNTKMIFFASTNDDPDLKSITNYASQLGFSNLFSLGAKENWEK